jgi:hypothetical protein
MSSAPRKPAVRAPRVDDVLADVRDRVRANGLDTEKREDLRDYCDEIATEIRAAIDTHVALHFDATVAPDFRELMLAVAAEAICAVVDHDRRALAARHAA